MTTAGDRPGQIDWGLGEYEKTAAELSPAAARVVSLAAIKPGERVLDIATGTGNAALFAAREGAVVSAVDRADRLLDVARGRAAAEHLEVSFRVGDMHELPFPDGSFEVVTSVFGLIFASEPPRALAEVIRVLAPGGRALISVWVPSGPVDAMIGVFMRAVAAVTGPPPPRFAWSDTEAVAQLLVPLGTHAKWHDGALTITSRSPETYLDGMSTHPMNVALAPVLEGAGIAEETRLRALEVLRAGNTDPNGFRISSPYRVIEIEAPAG